MRRLTLLISLIVMSIGSNAQIEGYKNTLDSGLHLIPRYGRSNIHGIAGIEVKKAHLGFSAGWFGSTSDKGYSTVFPSRICVVFGPTYYFSDKKNSAYIAAGYLFNGGAIKQETLQNSTPEWRNSLSILGGYRLTFYSLIDVRLGLGIEIRGSNSGNAAADFALGIILFNRKKNDKNNQRT
jgi:hypothetical protein